MPANLNHYIIILFYFGYSILYKILVIVAVRCQKILQKCITDRFLSHFES